VKQIVRRAIDSKGTVRVVELPEPHLGADQVLVRNHYSLISSGTELSTLAKTPQALAREALADPWMRQAIRQTVLSGDVGQTVRRVWHELRLPREIGYSGAGRVLAVGSNATGFRVGDTVAYAATGHAELVAPTVNHIAPVPERVDLRHAAFVTVGGIAIQALRRAEVQFGEVVAVYGLGLVGQLCAQVAKAAGAVVLGIDVNEPRNRLARELGADLAIDPTAADLERGVLGFTGKHGVDVTIVCASSKSSSIVNNAMKITRRQGRVVLVGYVGLDLHPKEFLRREIDLRYSRSYGPGSYDRAYGRGRIDYPFGYVRWTEHRNLGELIRLLASGALRLEPLIGGTFSIADAQRAFDALADGSLPGVAALIDFHGNVQPDRRRTLPVRPRSGTPGKLGISLVGCGNHVLAQHLPNLRRMSGVEIRGLVSATGKVAATVAASVDATVITTDLDEVLNDPATDAVMICSSHSEHAAHLLRAIEAGKPTFVEKPMVTKLVDFRDVAAAMRARPVLLTLGLNRRYSPMLRRLREAIPGSIDAVHCLVARRLVPLDHWTLDPDDGGGRLVAEGEHFLDLCHFLIGRPPISVYARALGEETEEPHRLCNFAVTVHYEGAVGHLVYSESGAAAHLSERVTVVGREQLAQLDDFAKLTVCGRRTTVHRSLRREMGHREQLQEFVRALRGEPNHLLGWEQATSASLTMLAAQESLRTGEPVDLRALESRLALGADPGEPGVEHSAPGAPTDGFDPR
jgi:polar amino acid transport system substrate-binding protein